MTTITIDYNNDYIEIQKPGRAKLNIPVRYPSEFELVITAIFDGLNLGLDGEGVRLESINEDIRKTVNEW